VDKQRRHPGGRQRWRTPLPRLPLPPSQPPPKATAAARLMSATSMYWREDDAGMRPGTLPAEMATAGMCKTLSMSTTGRRMVYVRPLTLSASSMCSLV